jgi:hypothetical protein
MEFRTLSNWPEDSEPSQRAGTALSSALFDGRSGVSGHLRRRGNLYDIPFGLSVK